MQRPMKEFGLMNRTEFNESMDALSPLISEKHRHKLFSESEQHCSEGRKVSVARLARILLPLEFHISDNINESQMLVPWIWIQDLDFLFLVCNMYQVTLIGLCHLF